jgi:hypothetical protein
MIEIPLTSKPEQLFSIVIKDTKYDMRVILNSRTGNWSLDLAVGGVDLVNGIALLPGADIFGQYNLGIGIGYIINLESPRQDPTRDEFGKLSRLFILNEEELQDGSPV